MYDGSLTTSGWSTQIYGIARSNVLPAAFA